MKASNRLDRVELEVRGFYFSLTIEESQDLQVQLSESERNAKAYRKADELKAEAVASAERRAEERARLDRTEVFKEGSD